MGLSFKSLTINRFISSIGGFTYAIYMGLSLKLDYIIFVSLSSICLTILSLTFQWSLIDIVVSQKSNIKNTIRTFFNQLLPILLLTFLIFLIIYHVVFDYKSFSGIFLGFVFILYTITNEIYNHLVIKFSFLRNPFIVNVIKASLLLFSYFFLESSLINVSKLTFILFIVNSISIYYVLKKRDINLIDNLKFYSNNIFSKENIIKANALFLTGLTLQSTRLTSSIISKTELNSILFLISDYSLIIMGFIFSILYWRIGPYLKQMSNNITSYCRYLFIFSIFITTVLEIIYKGSIYNDSVNNNVVFYIISILLLTLPIVFKTYIFDLYIINSPNSKYLIYSNISFVILFVSLNYIFKVNLLFDVMIIRSFLFSFLSYTLILYPLNKNNKIKN